MTVATIPTKTLPEVRWFPLIGLITLVVVDTLAVLVNPVRLGSTGLSVALTFAQLTDPHIFDAGKPRAGKPLDEKELEVTRETFDWALDELKKRKDLDFVVITGDFGLELVSPLTEDDSAKYVADKLKSLPVDVILFVPGNNDLLNEDFQDFDRYKRFIDRLDSLLAAPSLKRKTILDLSKHSYEFKGVRILGLESATFKNSNCKSFPNGCKEAYKYQLEKMESVRDELTINNTERKPSIIFTHIPDLYDPYKFDPNNPKQSWVLRQDARNTWDQTIAQNPLLKGVFAGHFHSQDRNDYGQRGNLIPKDPTRNSDLPFIVCPPLASKFQTIDQQTAQGLLIGTINPSSNAISYSITFRGFSAKP